MRAMWKLKHGQMWVGMWLWMAPLARTAGAGADESCEGLTDLDSPENGGGACTTDVDCWINGDCGATGCRCDTGWTGPHCELLDLLPAQDPEIGCVSPLCVPRCFSPRTTVTFFSIVALNSNLKLQVVRGT